MSDPLALLPLAIAAGGGRLGPFDASQLVAAGLTLLQRSAPLVRALAGKRSAILLTDGPELLVALAASDGRGALLLRIDATPEEIAWQLADAEVGAVFTRRTLVSRLPEGLPVVLLDDAPRQAQVVVPGRTNDVDLGSHHGLELEGDTAAEGRHEECVVVYGASGRREVHTHRDLISAGRAAVRELLLTPVDHVLSLLPCSDPDALAVCVAAPLMAGARVSFLSPRSADDVLTALEPGDVSMLAGRWHTATGPRVAAYGATSAIHQLRDGQLVLA
ncbi:AMP-binding protein [Gemmatimonas groenlandica]|uniref:AMP-dependent synthetase/ligase domain-containing protein n=1 Tax=Gemmatimonas groenlandica TaxID=2732249 RepID=A0A6M4II14_9BACT|nr:AMP-binding protein [Gemmatimonas groenlandica]QJR34443.1 hypothetical protein HKW67_02340 [Gemmatimonas groenlandica]